MKQFVITIQELCQHEFVVEAEEMADVEGKFWEEVCSGTYDWSNGAVLFDDVVSIEEVRSEVQI